MSSRKRIEELEKQIEANPKNVRLIQKLGELHHRAGDLRSAAMTFERVADQYADEGFFLKAVALLKQCQKLDYRPIVDFKLADLHARLQLVGEALVYLKQGFSKTTSPADLASAVPAVRRVRDCYPNDPVLRLSLVHILLRADLIDEARSELSAATALLRPAHEELAVAAEQIDVGAERTSVLGAVIRLRGAVDLRLNGDAVLRSLSFSQPN